MTYTCMAVEVFNSTLHELELFLKVGFELSDQSLLCLQTRVTHKRSLSLLPLSVASRPRRPAAASAGHGSQIFAELTTLQKRLASQ